MSVQRLLRRLSQGVPLRQRQRQRVEMVILRKPLM